MSASPTNADGLLTLIWIISISFTLISIFVCFGMSLRRYLRNRKTSYQSRQKQEFGAFAAHIMKSGEFSDAQILQTSNFSIADISDVLLQYFRTLSGDGHALLEDMVCQSDLETRLANATRTGVRGRRMRALKVLSYINSQDSLQVIFENLSSRDIYVRLTAARCLARRKALYLLEYIIDSLSDAFPSDHELLAGVLSEFGYDAIPYLEKRVTSTVDNDIMTACLEAMVLIMPARTSLDLKLLMQNPDESVRAAALALSGTAEHASEADLIVIGLKDEATKVKIRAAKLAQYTKRKDIVSDLYRLTDDPVMWVRYWAMKAIWKTGSTGQQFVDTLTDTNTMAANVAREMRAGYV